MLPPHYYFIMFMAALTMVLLRGRRQFDDVLEVLHRDHSDRWEAAGRPIGFFWQPEEGGAPWAEASRARGALFKEYMREVPDWMADDEALKSKLVWARVYLWRVRRELLELGIDRSPQEFAPARGPPSLW